MKVRAYSQEDFPEIVRVIQATDKTGCWPLVFPEGWSEERIIEEFEPMKNYKDSCFLVSEVNGEITGLIAGHDLRSFAKAEVPHLTERFQQLGLLDSYYQRDLIVHPNWQRRFGGVRLSRKLFEQAKQKGYDTLVTRTPPLNIRGIHFFRGIRYQELFEDNNPGRVYFWRQT